MEAVQSIDKATRQLGEARPPRATSFVSTVTPVYCGGRYLAELVERIAMVRQNLETSDAPLRLMESIFVIDDAIDDSAGVLKQLSERWPWVHVVNLSRNFGQHPATMAGILYTSGDWVVTLDEDLQHDPQCISALLRRAVTEHVDVVYAAPQHRVHSYRMRDFASRATKAVLARVLGNPHIPEFNSFRLLRGVVARAAASVCSHDTYLDVALCWFTYRIRCVELDLRDRRSQDGAPSGYSFRKLLGHARRLLVSSQSKLLRVGAWVGGAAMAGSLLAATVVLIIKLIQPERIPIQGWTSLILVVLFFGGLTSLLLSIVLEFLTNMSLHAQGKPTFFVVDRSGDDSLLEFFRDQNNGDPER